MLCFLQRPFTVHSVLPGPIKLYILNSRKRIMSRVSLSGFYLNLIGLHIFCACTCVLAHFACNKYMITKYDETNDVLELNNATR